MSQADRMGRRLRGRLATVVLALLAAASLTVPAQAAQKTTLRVTHWGGGDAANLFESYLAEFERLNPDIDVQAEPYPENYTEQLLVRFAAGSAPDVMLLDNPYVPAFVDRGLVEDLTPYIKAGKLDPDAYFKQALDIFARPGKVFGLPKGFTPIVMYYNKIHFNDSGVVYPALGWTYDDYLRLSQKLLRREGEKTVRWGTNYTNWTGYFVPQVWSYGGEFLSPEGSRATGYTDSPGTVAALQFLLDLAHVYRVAPTQAEMDALGGGLMTKGLAGMAVSGHWAMNGFAPALQKGDLNLGVIDLPRGPARKDPATVIYATAWAITNQARNKEAALRLVQFLAGPWVEEKENLGNYIEIPGRIDVARKLIQVDPFGVEQDFLRAAEFGRAPYGSTIPDYQQVETILTEAVDRAWTKGESLRNQLAAAAKRIDAWFEERR